jgi:hypothetical protein
MDQGREYDLIELSKAMDNARTVGEREHYERIAYKIMNESTKVQSLREKLIKSFRARDMTSFRAAQEEIQYWKQQETYGKSWGNNKGNRI